MRKRSMVTWDTNWQLLFLCHLCRFRNRNLWYTFKFLFPRKRDLAHLYLLHENESIQRCLLCDLRQIAIFLVFGVWGPFFLRSRVRVRAWFLGDAGYIPLGVQKKKKKKKTIANCQVVICVKIFYNFLYNL